MGERQLDEISGAIFELRADIRNIREDVKEVKEDVAAVDAKVDSINKTRWIGTGVWVAVCSAGSLLASKASVILAAVMKP